MSFYTEVTHNRVRIPKIVIAKSWFFDANVFSIAKLPDNLQPADHQHSVKKMRSTTYRPHKRTIMVELDMSKALDSVNHGILLQSFEQSTVRPPT